MDVTVVVGDIIEQNVDAIVTAAIPRLRGGSGVNGAVHAAAGPRLLQASLALAPCPPGDAVVTPAFDLTPVKWVIHAVGPRYSDAPEVADQLMSTYHSAFARADDVGARSIAFPSISTGAYGYPVGIATALSAEALRTVQTEVETVVLVAYHQDVADLWDYHLYGG